MVIQSFSLWSSMLICFDCHLISFNRPFSSINGYPNFRNISLRSPMSLISRLAYVYSIYQVITVILLIIYFWIGDNSSTVKIPRFQPSWKSREIKNGWRTYTLTNNNCDQFKKNQSHFYWLFLNYSINNYNYSISIHPEYQLSILCMIRIPPYLYVLLFSCNCH